MTLLELIDRKNMVRDLSILLPSQAIDEDLQSSPEFYESELNNTEFPYSPENLKSELLTQTEVNKKTQLLNSRLKYKH